MLTFSTNDSNILGGETIYTYMGCHGSNVCLFLLHEHRLSVNMGKEDFSIMKMTFPPVGMDPNEQVENVMWLLV